MPEYDNSQRGVLFVNSNRATENHPNMKGSGEINGVEVWISAWTKTKRGTTERYMSLSFENKEGQTIGHVTAAVPVATQDFAAPNPAEEDIPF